MPYFPSPFLSTQTTDLPAVKFRFFLLISFSHGVQGLKAVEDDYLSERTLGFLSANIAKYSSLARLLYLSINLAAF